MVDSLTLYNTMDHEVKVVDVNGNEHRGTVGLYESEWDSESGEAEIWFKNKMFKQSEIESIEIIDD